MGRNFGIFCLLLGISCTVSQETTCWGDVDIVFLMDASNSITDDNFLKEKAFVNSLAASFDLAPNKSRASVITYSDEAEPDIGLGEYSSLKKFQDKVNDIVQSKGNTRIDLALQLASRGPFSPGSSARPGVSKVAVVLTDGKQTQKNDSIPLQDAVQPLRDAGVRILVVAIGNNVDLMELDNLVERDDDIFIAQTFDDLRQRAKDITKRKCKTEPSCKQRADVAFLMEDSISISEGDFQMEKDFVKAVASSFHVNSTEARLGLTTYSANPLVRIPFGQYTDIDAFKRFIDAMRRDGGPARIDQAIRLFLPDLFVPVITDGMATPKVLVFLTDGNQSLDPDTIEPLGDLGVRTYIIAVGKQVNLDELRPLVQKKDHVVAVSSFADLLSRSRQISRQICDLVIVPPESTCSENADVAFVMDASESMSSQDFQKQKNFVNTIASAFNIGPQQTKCGLITFGDEAKLSIRFMDGSDLHSFQEAVQKVPSLVGSTGLDAALRLAVTDLFTAQAGARSAMPKILIVLTSSTQTLSIKDAGSLKETAQSLVELGVRVYVVAVGDSENKADFGQLVQNDQDVLAVADYDDLQNQARHAARRTCELIIIPPAFMCTNYADVAFVMDAYLSIGDSDFQREKDFVNSMASSLNIGPEKTHLGLITFSSKATLSIKFTSYIKLFPFQEAVQRVTYDTGSTRLDKALLVASDQLFTPSGGVRSEVNQVLFILTGDTQTFAPDAIPLEVSVEALRRKAVRVYVIGIGDTVNHKELRQLVQRDQDLLLVDDFGQLFNRTRQIARKICNLTIAKPVDGKFNEWQEWNSCSKTCGYGRRARLRLCSNPSPAYGGQDCVGQRYQDQYCQIKPCPVDGLWSAWRRWEFCTRTCGGGVQIRRRLCTNPPPSNEGKDCVGPREETRPCNAQPCPVHGNWTEWGDWFECTASCGEGSTRRERNCTNPKPEYGGRPCEGESFETKLCNNQPCPIHGNWTEWEDWFECSKSCGEGSTRRQRTCTSPRPEHGGRQCEGNSSETKVCTVQPCPIHGNWTEWGDWFECTTSCGQGSTRRERNCTNPKPEYGGRPCEGESFETKLCNNQPCPIDGNWSEWGDWFECSKSCGEGSTRRQRTCTSPKPEHGGRPCEGKTFETKTCNNQPCPVNGNWTDWSEWSLCMVTCGGGTQHKMRTCSNPAPAHGGEDCPGSDFDIRLCNEQACPVDGNWTSWSDWESCSVSCGGGNEKRTRTCTNPAPAHGGKPCDGRDSELRSCGDIPCPAVSQCHNPANVAFVMDASTSIGIDDFNKEKQFVKQVAGSFQIGPSDSQVGLITYSSNATLHIKFDAHADIGDFEKAVDGLPYSGGQTRIDKALKLAADDMFTSAGGARPRLPKVMIILTDGGQTPDPDAVALNEAVVPLRNLGVKIFAVGVGARANRTELRLLVERKDDIFTVQDFNELLQKAQDIAERSCKVTWPGKVDGNWTSWSDWESCSVSCGGGNEKRTRTCTSPAPAHGGKPCDGRDSELRSCGEIPCPVHGGWSSWTTWSSCTKSCNGGTSTRQRSCTDPSPDHGGRTCNGSTQETESCSVQPCPIIQCTEKAYVAILMDASGSITVDDFKKEKDFVKKFATKFVIGQSSGLGLISYSHEATIHARFSDYDSLRKFQEVVEEVPHVAKSTRIDKALRLASNYLFRTTRGRVLSQHPRVMVVLTDGRQTADPDAIPLEDAVPQLRELGVRVFAVAVGQADAEQLRLLVERDEDVFAVRSFTDLLEAVDRITERVCQMIILPPVPLCEEKVGIGFVMDASGSIGKTDFQKERDFVKAFASSFNVSKSQTLLGLIDYSTEANLRIKFDDHEDLASFQAAVDDVPYQGNTTRIDRALDLAATDLFNASVALPQIMIILSDGVQTADPDAKPLRVAVQPLREMGVKVVAVGVGIHTDRLELLTLVERESDLFDVTDFTDLLNKAHDISRRTCDVARVRCNSRVNLGFVLDASSSIGNADFKTEKEFVKRIAASFRVGLTDMNPGVITFNDDATLHIKLGDHRTMDSFRSAVNRIPYLGGATRIDEGLIKAATSLFSSNGDVPPVIPQVLILLTDGRQSSHPVQEAVQTLQHMGVKIIAVGVGSEIDDDQLGAVVEEEEDLFVIEDFHGLLEKVHLVAGRACDGETGEHVLQEVTCSVEADVGFLMDTSESIGSENFMKQNEFLKDLVSSTFQIGMQQTRVGVITYNENATIEITFDQHDTVDKFNQAVTNFTYRPGGSRLGNALQLAASQFFSPASGSRFDVPKVLVVLTDGNDESDSGAVQIRDAVKLFREAGVRVLAVGIGMKADPDELGLLVEREEDVFFVQDYNDLRQKTMKISLLSCDVLFTVAKGRINGGDSACPNTIDLGFVIDSSSSTGPEDFEKEKELIKAVAIHFDISKPGTRAGVIVYSDNAVVNIRLDQYKNYTAFERAINMLPYFGKGNRKDRALRAANTLFKSRNPRDASDGKSKSKVMFLLTEGKQTGSPDMRSLRAAAQPLHQSDVKVVVLGIGRQARYKELNTIAGDSKNVFMVKSLQEIHNIAETLRRKACEIPSESKSRT